jgi:hypothetical protein
VISGIQNNIVASQNVTIKYGAVSQIDQKSTYNSVMSYLEKNQVMNNILTSEELDEFQTLYNDQNTLDTLGKAVVANASIFTKLITTLAGKVTFVVVCITAFLVVLVIVVFIVQKIRQAIKKR